MRPKAWEHKSRIFTEHAKAWELPGHTGLYSQDGKNTIFNDFLRVFWRTHKHRKIRGKNTLLRPIYKNIGKNTRFWDTSIGTYVKTHAFETQDAENTKKHSIL